MAAKIPEDIIAADKYAENLSDQRDEVLALQSTLEDGVLSILSEPPEEQSDHTDAECFILQINVQVEQSATPIAVEAWIPHEHELKETDRLNVAPVGNKRPCFERSQSGRRWHSSFQVSYLPPLCLQVTLPACYPSDVPPVFSLSSVWLDASQLSSLCRELDVLWGQYHGSPILYIWIDWLQSTTYSHLCLSDAVILTPHQECDAEMFGPRDPRALPACSDLCQDLNSVLRYDMQKEMDVFRQSPHECGVCFEEKTGREFYRLNECKHHFCQDCLVAYCVMHVQDGTVHQLQCPDPDCKCGLPVDVIRAVLGDEEYERWERLLLQKALDTMEDIEWCPRCNSAVIRESQQELNLAYCTTCVYSFCTSCRMPWHQGIPCTTLEDRLKELEEKSKENTGEDESDDISTTEKYRMWKLEYLSKSIIKKIAKPCPKCKIPIEKSEGCNKVSCIKCGTCMCYVCGKQIKGYDHFRSGGCDMINAVLPTANVPLEREVPEGAQRAQAAMEINIGQIAACPRCQQRNLKDGRNNHLRCWCCKGNFCCMCKKIITGNVTEHYKAGLGCLQHSD